MSLSAMLSYCSLPPPPQLQLRASVCVSYVITPTKGEREREIHRDLCLGAFNI